MIQGKWYAPGDVPAQVLAVREAVFGTGRDSTDDISWNTLIFLDGEPVAAGRIWWSEGSFVLGSIGVLPEKRGQKYGDLVLRLLLFKAREHAAGNIVLDCPDETVGFFERLGFRAAAQNSGLTRMEADGSMIDLDTCKNCRKKDCPNRQE